MDAFGQWSSLQKSIFRRTPRRNKSMTNEIIRQFFKNYLFIREQGFDAFTREQSKLFSPKLVTLVSDTRGSFIYEALDGFFEGRVPWPNHFLVTGYSRHDHME